MFVMAETMISTNQNKSTTFCFGAHSPLSRQKNYVALDLSLRYRFIGTTGRMPGLKRVDMPAQCAIRKTKGHGKMPVRATGVRLQNKFALDFASLP